MLSAERCLEAADALRRVALEHPDVAGLDETARYETHGRSATVRGVRLREAGTVTLATLGVLLDAEAVLGRPVPEVVHTLRQALHVCWTEMLGIEQELILHIDVVDLGTRHAVLDT